MANFNGAPFRRLPQTELARTVQSLDVDATLSEMYSVECMNWDDEAKRQGFHDSDEFLLAQLLRCDLQLWQPACGLGKCLALAGESSVKAGGRGPYAFKETCMDALRRIMQSSVFRSMWNDNALKLSGTDRLDAASALLELAHFRSKPETEEPACSAMSPTRFTEPRDAVRRDNGPTTSASLSAGCSADHDLKRPLEGQEMRERQSKRIRRWTNFFDPSVPVCNLSDCSNDRRNTSSKSFSVGDVVSCKVMRSLMNNYVAF